MIEEELQLCSRARKLGERVRRERERRGISQAELARRIDRDSAYLSHLEHGHYRQPAKLVLHKIARVLGMNVQSLTLLTEDRSPSCLLPMSVYLEEKYGLDDQNAAVLADQFTEAISRHFEARATEVRAGKE